MITSPTLSHSRKQVTSFFKNATHICAVKNTGLHNETAWFPTQWLNCAVRLGKELMLDDERQRDKQWKMFLYIWKRCGNACITIGYKELDVLFIQQSSSLWSEGALWKAALSVWEKWTVTNCRGFNTVIILCSEMSCLPFFLSLSQRNKTAFPTLNH